MKIKTKLYGNLVLGIGLAIVFALILVWSSYQIDSELEQSETANKLVRETTDLIMVGEEYLVYRYPRTILQWKAKYDTTMAVLKDMKKSAESDRIKKNLVTLNKSFLKLKENFFETRSHPEERLSQAYLVLDERLSGQMRILSRNIIGNALKLSMEATNQTRRIEQKGSVILFVFLGLFILLTAASLFSTIKKITISLAGLERDANIINNGNLKHKISTGIDLPNGPRDEIEELSRSFSSMTDRLVKSIEKLQTEVAKRTEAEDKLKKAHEGLEKKVEERTEELAKANNELTIEVDDRKQAERALKKSEEKFRAIFNNAQVALFRTRISDGKLIEINQRYANMAGYSNVEDCMAEFNAADSWVDSNARDELVGILEKEGAVKDYETEIIRRDGTRSWIMFSATIFPEHGFLEGSIVDISDRKQAERELGESEEKHRALIENLSDAILILNKDGLNVWNSPAVRQYGLEPEDAIGRPFDEFIHPDDIGKSRKSWDEMIANPGKVFTVEHRASGTPENPDTWIYQHNKLVYLPDAPGINGVVCVCRNETEQKLSEIALRGSEEKYRNILESMEEGYYEVDLAGNFTFVNDAMCEIRGYAREELIGMNNRQYMTEETAKKVFKAFSNIYTIGKPAKNLEWETVRKDGSKRFVETSAYIMKDSKDVPRGFRGIVRDISEKHRLEAQLQHAKRMESIGTLAGGIAHNFNNLLMGIQGNTSMMLLNIDSGNPRHKNLKNIEKLVENGAKLTAQLIGYAREGSYEVKPTSLNQLVKETSDTFGMTKKEITVHQGLSEKLYGIKADQGQIEQVLLNLYVNAADAMPEGGDLFLKTINVTDKDITGKPYKVQLGNYVLLTVRDTGAGMDKETRERIFEPFFTTKGLASGTGLGMASAYGTVKGHGGYIDVDSEKGKGTTFSIYLPATKKTIEEKKVSPDELVKGEGTVLLVDDEEMVLESGEELLKYLGYEVLLADNGQKGLELYKKNQHKIDLVLLDMVMPVMGGGEAFDRMKEINTNVKVLLSSGYSLEGEAKEILKRGCDAFIQKPFKLEQLSQKLIGILRKK